MERQFTPDHKPGRYAFSVFTFDADSGELLRKNRKVRIPHQMSLLLTVLLERAGSVVSRDELQQMLWPNGEFLDHERAINRTVNQLRSTLGDEPRNSRYIETIPKRGYRFCATVTALPEPTREPATALAAAEPVQGLGPASSASAALELIAQRALATQHLIDAEEIEAKPLVPQVARWIRWGIAAVLAVAAAAGTVIGWKMLHRPPPAQANVVHMGILPFDAQGPDADRLAESLRLDLMDTVSQLPHVELHAAHSLAHVNHDDAGIRAVASTLHLDVLLFGKLTITGDNCVLEFELVRGSDLDHLASFQYSSSKDGLALVRSKLQRDIFTQLQLTGKPLQSVQGSTQDAQAYTDYLEARDSASRRTVRSLESALQHYQAATARDPGFARAYAGMAAAHLSMSDFKDVDVHLREARLNAGHALELDPTLAEAHGVLGGVAFRGDWNAPQAERELRDAVQLEPFQASYHAWLAEILVDDGRFDEALHEVSLAQAYDPFWPQLYAIEVLVCGAARQNGRMLEAARKYMQLLPESPEARDLLAWSLFSQGRYREAIAEWRAMAQSEKDEARIVLEDRGLAAFERGGAVAYAETRIDAMEKGFPTASHPNDFIPAEWYAFAGRGDKAIAELNAMVVRHESEVLEIAVNPMFDNLHHDPHFLAIVRRLGFTIPAPSHKATQKQGL